MTDYEGWREESIPDGSKDSRYSRGQGALGRGEGEGPTQQPRALFTTPLGHRLFQGSMPSSYMMNWVFWVSFPSFFTRRTPPLRFSLNVTSSLHVHVLSTVPVTCADILLFEHHNIPARKLLPSSFYRFLRIREGPELASYSGSRWESPQTPSATFPVTLRERWAWPGASSSQRH